MIPRIPSWVRVPVLFFIIFGLMEYAIDSGDQPAIIAYPITQLFLGMVLILLIAIEVILKSVENIMVSSLSAEAKARYLEEKTATKEITWGKTLLAKLTRSKAIDREEEIILDHNYDGIRELNNVLPPWWVYLFYVTIVFGLIYLVRFHIVGEYDQKLEYEQEVAAAKIAIEEYKKTAKDLVDASTVVVLTDAADLKAGEKIFTANCVACHMADGGGGIGPNLTDEYWILGGGIKNVFSTISEGGRDGKGMIAWKQTLKPAEIAQVASYVLQFQGKASANPKAAEGDLWLDPDAPVKPEVTPAEQVVDSTKSSVIAMN